MISFGFGEVFAGALQGWFIDKYSSRSANILNLAVIIVMIAVSMISIYSEQFNILTFIMSFLWGVQDGVINTHTYQVLGS